jgi:hypothetical protein
MRNKALALFRDSIPYIKQLRQLTDSVTAAILMQQLDYRFNTQPEGFYKFLEPCDNEYYREGDSWTEELGFSEEEFRGAFDKLGVRYRSKQQFEARPAAERFLDEEGNPRFYASYHNKIKGYTWYFRNHALVDDLLDSLFQHAQPAAPAAPQATIAPPSVDRQSRVPVNRKTAVPVTGETPVPVTSESRVTGTGQSLVTEAGNAEFRNSANPGSVTGESRVTEPGKAGLDIEAENTTENTAEKHGGYAHARAREDALSEALFNEIEALIRGKTNTVNNRSDKINRAIGNEVAAVVSSAQTFEAVARLPDDLRKFNEAKGQPKTIIAGGYSLRFIAWQGDQANASSGNERFEGTVVEDADGTKRLQREDGGRSGARVV